MTTSPKPVIFRSAEIERELDTRAGSAERNSTARRDLERYYAVLRAELAAARLTLPEASLIMDALNGTRMDHVSYRLLWAEIVEAMEDADLAGKWGVSAEALTERLRALTPAQSMAIVDAIERAWAAVARGDARPPGEILADTGL